MYVQKNITLHATGHRLRFTTHVKYFNIFSYTKDLRDKKCFYLGWFIIVHACTETGNMNQMSETSAIKGSEVKLSLV